MKKVGAYEAKTHLPALLKAVSKGERVSITRKGVPIAILVPASAGTSADPGQISRKLREFRKGLALEEFSVGELVAEGRRS